MKNAALERHKFFGQAISRWFRANQVKRTEYDQPQPITEVYRQGKPCGILRTA